MNYRHIYHAGNHADVLKHVVLLACLRAMQVKPKPLFVLDTHAGRGDYALDSVEAGKTAEAAGGIGRLHGQPPRNAAVQAYLAALAALGADGKCYPGSPRLLAAALRAQDRLAACELQPDEAAALREVLAPYPNCAVHRRDGYEALRALLPPKEKRALVLIDPPYEQQLDEFHAIEQALAAALQRLPDGSYLLWYPIKTRRALQPSMRRLAALPAKRTLRVELLIRPDDSPLRMNGSGLLLFNPPWQIEQALEPALAELAATLGERASSWRMDYLKQDAA